jgi:transposase-like protein
MGRRTYSDEQKAEVMAALLAGQSVREVAEAYHIPPGTVANWSSAMTRTHPTDASTKKEIGDLILEYLREVLMTLVAQQKVFRNETWLQRQPASEAAVLHGVLADKGIRLLEALAGDDDGEAPVV